MPIITPDQAVVESVKANALAHVDRLSESVGRVLSKRPKNRAVHSASGIFISYKGEEYFLTAAHPFVDKGTDDLLLVGTRRKAISIREATHSYSKDASITDDVLDVGVLRISQHMRNEIGPTHPIAIDHMISHHLYEVGRNFMIVGYPRSKNKRPIQSDLPTTNRSVFISGLRESQVIGAHGSVRAQTHIVIGWSDNTANLQGEKIVAHSALGMSGAPIFDLGDYSDFGVLAGTDRPTPLLAGVFTRHGVQDKALIGTRLNALVDVLNRESSWPSH